MLKTSIIPELINSEAISLEDENGVPVKICNRSEFLFNYNAFKTPSILIDNFERDKYKEIEIKSIDLEYLSKLGFRIVSVKCYYKIRNYPKQLQSYMLESPIQPIPKCVILNKIPKDHLIEYDVTNNRVRIKGRNGYPYFKPENATKWVQVVKK